MPPAMLDTTHFNRVKRFFWKNNLNMGGVANKYAINGDNNYMTPDSDKKGTGQETLVRKAGHQIGRILEGGTDLVVAPSKWLTHMQENWLAYLIFGTILLMCVLFIYCCVRRKMQSHTAFTSVDKNASKMAVMEAMELAALRRSLPDI